MLNEILYESLERTKQRKTKEVAFYTFKIDKTCSDFFKRETQIMPYLITALIFNTFRIARIEDPQIHASTTLLLIVGNQIIRG
jgi:hypothetical protein